MTETYEPLVECSVEIAAPAAAVWEVVGDVRRMPELSPYVLSTRLRAGFDDVALGTEFTNLNRMGEVQWTTHGEVVRFSPGDAIAFRIAENWVVWSFQLEAVDPGVTRLVQRRETPDGISPRSLQATDASLGGQQVFTQALRDGMRETLERVKTLAESNARP